MLIFGMENFDTILKNGTVILPGETVKTDIGLRGGKIVAFGSFYQAGDIIDCTGLHVLPGVIDTQVHFREPGMEQK